MKLLVVYLALVVTGAFVAYSVGYLVESAASPSTSLLAFLAVYFLSLGVAWHVAVRMTAPKSTPA
jgi:hypothetical protein